MRLLCLEAFLECKQEAHVAIHIGMVKIRVATEAANTEKMPIEAHSRRRAPHLLSQATLSSLFAFTLSKIPLTHFPYVKYEKYCSSHSLSHRSRESS